MMGKELVEYITGLRGRIDEVSKIEEVWVLNHGD